MYQPDQVAFGASDGSLTQDPSFVFSNGAMSVFYVYKDNPGWIKRDGSVVAINRRLLYVPTNHDTPFQVEVRASQSGTVSQGKVGVYVEARDDDTVMQFTVTNVADNGSGAYRITAPGHSFNTDDSITIYGVNSPLTVNNVWIITVIDANTFDLNGSTSGGVYTNGGMATNRCLIYGIQVNTVPKQSRGGFTGNPNGDDFDGVVVNNIAGTQAKATDAFYLGHNGIFGNQQTGAFEWMTGFTVDANCTYGIRLNAHYSTAIDLTNARCDYYVIKFPGGQGISNFLVGSSSWSPPSLAKQAASSITFSVPGATLGDLVTVSYSLDLQGQQLTGYVSSAGNVTCVLQNVTSNTIHLNQGTIKASVMRV
jgi:hypothetical protein